MQRSAVFGFVLVPMFASPAAAGVWVVDANRPSGFTDIQSAVDAASDGDTLLVKSGNYAGFAVVGKALTVIADELAEVAIDGAIQVRQIGAEKTVLLAGLSAVGNTELDGNGLSLADNAGIVWIESCSMRGRPSQACSEPSIAARIDDSDRVIFIRTELRGAESMPGQGAGGDGLHVLDSSLFTHNCAVIGGAASWQECDGGPMNGANGGSGARVDGASFLFMSADRYIGAEGGGGGHTAAGGNGGTGLIVLARSQVESFATALIAGAGGLGSGCGLPECGDGLPGAESSGDIHTIAGAAATFTSGTPVREGMPVIVIVYGIPGERFAFDIASEADFQYAPGQRGVRVTRGGRRMPLGWIPPSGVIGVFLTAPLLVPGEGARRSFLQSVHWGSSGPFTLGSVRTIVVLDSEL